MTRRQKSMAHLVMLHRVDAVIMWATNVAAIVVICLLPGRLS